MPPQNFRPSYVPAYINQTNLNSKTYIFIALYHTLKGIFEKVNPFKEFSIYEELLDLLYSLRQAYEKELRLNRI